MNQCVDIVVQNRNDAEEVINQLKSFINRYGYVTIADLYDLVGMSSTFTDVKYGWYILDGECIKETSIFGDDKLQNIVYTLELPEPKYIELKGENKMNDMKIKQSSQLQKKEDYKILPLVVGTVGLLVIAGCSACFIALIIKFITWLF